MISRSIYDSMLEMQKKTLRRCFCISNIDFACFAYKAEPMQETNSSLCSLDLHIAAEDRYIVPEMFLRQLVL